MNSREVHEHETRDTSPIQGSSLPDVILEGGVVGKVTHFLSNPIGGKPGADAPAAGAPAAGAAGAAPAAGGKADAPAGAGGAAGGAGAPKAGGPTPPQAVRK